MDNAGQSSQFTDDSSLEANETAITKMPAASVQPENQPQEPAFVGYRPPQPKRWRTFVKRNAVKLATALIVCLVVIVSLGIFIASSRTKELQLTAPPQSSPDAQTAQEITEEDDGLVKAETMTAQYSFSKDGKMYKLVSDGEIWLERAEGEWTKFTTADNWLFYTSNKTPAGTNPDSGTIKVGVEAFNFKTKAYIELGEIDPPAFASLETPMKVQGDFLYIPMSGYRTGGATYRCRLDKEKACGSLELFYDQPGTVHVVNENDAYLLNTFADADVYSYTLSRLSIATKQTTEIKKGGSTSGVGEYVGGFSDEGLVWIAKTGTAMQGTTTVTGVVEQLSAFDITGSQKFVITPESFPLPEPEITFQNAGKPYEMLFANRDQQVAFDLNKKEFDALERRQTDVQGDSISDFLSNAEETLQLPSLFSIKEIL